MPSSPSELLELSKQLAAIAVDETWQRCVVSRAYYASLHATDATFPRTSSDVRREGESSHAEIINRAVSYGKSVKPGRSYANQIAQALPRLRRFRNFADYDLSETLPFREYEEMLLRVERVLEHCSDVERLRENSVQPLDAGGIDPGTSIQTHDAAQSTPSSENGVRPILTRIK